MRVQSVEYNFISAEIGPLTILNGANVGEELALPNEIEISAYPNPFNSALRISAPEGASSAIFDIRGVLVCDIGEKRIWTPSEEIESGIYFISVKYDGESRIFRAVYLK